MLSLPLGPFLRVALLLVLHLLEISLVLSNVFLMLPEHLMGVNTVQAVVAYSADDLFLFLDFLCGVEDALTLLSHLDLATVGSLP